MGILSRQVSSIVIIITIITSVMTGLIVANKVDTLTFSLPITVFIALLMLAIINIKMSGVMRVFLYITIIIASLIGLLVALLSPLQCISIGAFCPASVIISAGIFTVLDLFIPLLGLFAKKN